MSIAIDHTLSNLLLKKTDSDGILKKNQQIVNERIKKEAIKRKESSASSKVKRAIKELAHVKCDFSTAELDRKLVKIATKGVVALFNAVQKQQKDKEPVAKKVSVFKKRRMMKGMVSLHYTLHAENPNDIEAASVKIEGEEKEKHWDQESDQDDEDENDLFYDEEKDG